MSGLSFSRCANPLQEGDSLLLRRVGVADIQSLGYPDVPDCNDATPTVATSSSGRFISFVATQQAKETLLLFAVPDDLSPLHQMSIASSLTDLAIELYPGNVIFRGENEVLVNRFTTRGFAQVSSKPLELVSYRIGEDSVLTERAVFDIQPNLVVGAAIPRDERVALIEQLSPSPHQWLVLDLPAGANRIEKVGVLSKIPIETQASRRSDGVIVNVSGRRILFSLEGPNADLHSWDLSAPERPTSLERAPLPASAPPANDLMGQAIDANERWLVVAPNLTTLHIYSIDAEAKLHFESTLAIDSFPATKLVVRLLGDWLVLRTPETSLSVFSLADPKSPQLLAQHFAPDHWVFDVAPDTQSIILRGCHFINVFRIERN